MLDLSLASYEKNLHHGHDDFEKLKFNDFEFFPYDIRF